MHSSRQNNHRRPARISDPCASDTARWWAANMGCDVKPQNKALQSEIKNHRSTIHIGSPDPSIQARLAGCPVLARCLRKGGFAAKSRKSRIINKSKSFGRVRSTLRPILPSIRNQKSSINNSRVPCPAHVGAGALTCSAERSSANASNLTQWHSASPGPRLCSESPPNHDVLATTADVKRM